MLRLPSLDRKILNEIQKDLPLSSRPFREVARRLGIAEEKCLERIDALKQKGLIRHIAASLNHRNLGYKGTLIAARVPKEEIEALAQGLVADREVTHCYWREGEFNLWIAFIYRHPRVLAKFLSRLRRAVGGENVMSLPSKKQFKLKTSFRLG